MITKKYVLLLAVGLITVGFLTAVPAFAESGQGSGTNKPGETDFNKMMPAVVGKVSAINGNTITVIGKQGPNKGTATASTTFTIDATNAKILRGETTIKISDIAVGDNIIIQGTVTGTNVVATIIRDGKMGNGNENDNNQAFAQIQGNGQPVIAGTISAISGSTLTVKNANVTYTVDATSAKIIQGKNTILISGVKVGDSVIVQGTVTGTTVVASILFDPQLKAADNKTNSDNNGKSNWFFGGMFGGIGNFFKHLFGF